MARPIKNCIARKVFAYNRSGNGEDYSFSVFELVETTTGAFLYSSQCLNRDLFGHFHKILLNVILYVRLDERCGLC